MIRTWRWRGAPFFFPFFLSVGAFGATVSEAVTCKPSIEQEVSEEDHRLERFCYLKQVASTGPHRLVP